MVSDDPQAPWPIFLPFGLDVEWKSIPHNLMYETLDLKNKIEKADQDICSTFVYFASPPDYEEGTEEKQLQYAQLGLLALELATRLRKYGGLPEYEMPEYCNPSQSLKDKRTKIQTLRESRAKPHEE